MELIAALETAKELRSDIYISSYNLKRAFDSVDRKLLLFAWIRLGIPLEVALYLVSMDVDAMMAVQSPLAVVTHNKYGIAGLEHFNLCFHPQQGTAQGGVDSSLIFAAFLDILVCAIDSTSSIESSFYMSDIDGTLQPSEPIAYVDDLICIQGTSSGLQRTADIVSGFCSIFHLQLNIKKFRAFAIYWGNPREMTSSMLIHTSEWIPTVVPLQHNGIMEHLGVEWDMDITNETMFAKTVDNLNKAINHILSSKAESNIKLSVLRVSLLDQLVYKTKFAP